MSNQEREELKAQVQEELVVRVRAGNMPIYKAIITCSIAVCTTVIGAAVYIKTNFNNHELRIGIMERKWEKFEDRMLTIKK